MEMMSIPHDERDKTTIVSIFPKLIDEIKVTLFPGRFIIPAGSLSKPSTLTVGPSKWMLTIYDKDSKANDRVLEYPVNSWRLAESIINDYAKGMLGFSKDIREPGFFIVPGEQDVKSIQTNHADLLKKAAYLQKSWYEEIIKIADVDWARTNGNPRAIPDDARLAAQELGLAKGKVWMQDFNTLELTSCPACGHMRNGNFPVCSNCKTIIDQKKYKELNLAVAG